MGILNKIRELKEKRSREKEIHRYAEEARLENLEKKEMSELEQDKRLSAKRNSILKIREEKRKLNPTIVDKLFKPVSSRPKQREKSYSSVWGESKKQGGQLFNTVSNPGFHQGFTDVIGSSINSGYSRRSQSTKSYPVYVKKGKKFIKIKHKKQRSHSGGSGYDPIWGNSFGI